MKEFHLRICAFVVVLIFCVGILVANILHKKSQDTLLTKCKALDGIAIADCSRRGTIYHCFSKDAVILLD